MANDLVLDILGTSFTITADEDEAYLRDVLVQYRAAVENTHNISGIQDPLNIAVLTGFLLCDEINKMKLGRDSESDEAEQRALRIIAKLDQALKSNKPNG
ncbi:MAG: cell division protein ZapA [Treponema sp.]|jgi:cell division protein ZapA (FtsZ GTPase activity inhibitor)|nr:cell division protein ZapA [Treponema sp.]